MSPHPTQDRSLYEIALSVDPLPHSVQVSPATLRSLVEIWLDWAIEQKVAATLWAKLPRHDSWFKPLQRYHQRSGTAHTIYLFQGANAPSSEEFPSGESTAARSIPTREFCRSLSDDGTLLVGDEDRDRAEVAGNSQVYALDLSSDSPLRREYFLLIHSETFCGLILAHRPRSARQENQVGQRTPPLLALCSIDGHTLERILTELQRATQPDPAALGDWTGEFPFPHSQERVMLTHLWNRQIQQQEQVWRNANRDRKQAERTQTLQRQNEELLELIREKDDFLDNLGQQLRAPLANMKTALSLLDSSSLKAAQRQRYLQLLHTECERQTSLVNGLLDLVRLDFDVERIVVQPLHLGEIVPGVVSTYQPLAREQGVMLAYTVPADLPPVACANEWLKQIVIRLLQNGIKFTPRGGQVWVRAKQQGDYVQLEFRDTGIGIPHNEIPKIFDRFYRGREGADLDPSGAGLGLTIVQQLLLRCGGSISVRSRVSQGSVFNVLLPIYHDGNGDRPEARE